MTDRPPLPHPIPVFDLGGVFVDWEPLYLFRKLFETEEEAVWFKENICTLAWNLEFDRGVLFADGVARLTTRHPKYWRQIAAYDQRWREMLGDLHHGTIALHDELVRQNIPTYAITNFSWEKWMPLLGEWPFLEKFDGVVVSGLEGFVKPDPRIFGTFCKRFGLRASDCVFIDDSELNVHGARAVGMQALHFTSSEKLRDDLIALGLPLQPAR